MIKKQSGITLVSLIITIVVMLIISSTVVYVSLDRFEINNFNKMKNDIELLEDKVSNYYLKYNVLPIARDVNNKPIEYELSLLSFENGKYYILDLEAMDGISLNYGKEGFESPNSSNDVYVINEITHNVYYVKGIELKGIIYNHYIVKENVVDNIPPSKPQINVISGTLDDNGKYITEVKVEIIPGNDNWSGVNTTNKAISKNGLGMTEQAVEALKINGLYTISENGIYVITATTQDNSGNTSTEEITIVVEIPENIS